MKLKGKVLLALAVAALSVGVSTQTTQAKNKVWHYRVATGNHFSYQTFHRAYVYGHYGFMELYTTAANASVEKADTGLVINNRQKFYARKVRGHEKDVAQIYYNGDYYYMNYNDTSLYRYNTWRSGNKIVSLYQPTQTGKILLRANTRVYASQYWLYNSGSKEEPFYDYYKLSGKSNWYQDYSK